MAFVDLLVPIILAFREGLEAILIIVIILLYLKKTQNQRYYKYVYSGSVLAILFSIIFAILFSLLFGGFTGILEKVFEGLTFIISGLFIITLILWVSREGPRMKVKIEEKVDFTLEKGKAFSITLLVFIIIIREGIELVLLLAGATSLGALNQFTIVIGSLIGLFIALFIGFLTFYGVRSINMKVFFKITNIILILFAAGLITYGIHELIEAGIVNPIIEEVWNIKHILPESFPDGNPATPEWLEIIGSLLKALFGYNANPALLEIITYPTLLISIGLISFYLWNKNNKN